MSSGGASSSSPADKAMPRDQAGPGSSPGTKRKVVIDLISDSDDGLPPAEEVEPPVPYHLQHLYYSYVSPPTSDDEDAGCASGQAVSRKRPRPKLTPEQLRDYYSMEEGVDDDDEPLVSLITVRRELQEVYREACVPKANEDWTSSWTLRDIELHKLDKRQDATRKERNRAAREKRAAAKAEEKREIAEGKAAIAKLKQKEAELKAKEAELASVAPTECCLCLSAPSDVVLNPCGHRCVCSGCYERMPKERDYFQGSWCYTVQCPICRAQAKKIRVYG